MATNLMQAIAWGIAAVALPACAASADAAMPSVPPDFTIEPVAKIDGARELAVAPNGDLFVGTSGNEVQIVRHADGTPAPPQPFAHFDDREAAGIALSGKWLYVGTHLGVWRVPYREGDEKAGGAPEKLASVRPLGQGGHSTTSVAVSGETLFVSVGSSCNACVETDPTRATIQQLPITGGALRPKALHIRNAIALAVDPDGGALWAGVAGRDDLEHGHPYEIFDDITAHAGTTDYGWPNCYENAKAASGDTNCANTVVPRVVFPAYETPIGAAFYPAHPSGAHAFPEKYRGGAFVALHGSWHVPLVAPRVAFVAIRGEQPETAVNWDDANAQWSEFLGGYQNGVGMRSGRPTGVAVGPDGSLFVADDQAGRVYRIRPKT